MTIWVTADDHYYHNNILKYCQRNFNSIQEMNDTLVSNFNSVVKSTDTAYFLGDFSLSNDYEKLFNIFNRLNCCNKILVAGNHDSESCKKLPWNLVTPYHELKYKNNFFCMMHYPIKIWNKKHHGAICLGGHSHLKRNEFKERYMDVGVDANSYFPVDLDTIIDTMQSLTDYKSSHH